MNFSIGGSKKNPSLSGRVWERTPTSSWKLAPSGHNKHKRGPYLLTPRLQDSSPFQGLCLPRPGDLLSAAAASVNVYEETMVVAKLALSADARADVLEPLCALSSMPQSHEAASPCPWVTPLSLKSVCEYVFPMAFSCQFMHNHRICDGQLIRKQCKKDYFLNLLIMSKSYATLTKRTF